MPAVHEQSWRMGNQHLGIAVEALRSSNRHSQFRGAIVLIIRKLLLAHTRQVPKDDPSVVAAAAQYASLSRVPRQRRHRVVVALERVHFLLDVSDVPDADCFVGRSRSNKHLRGRVESQGIDGIEMATLGDECCLVCVPLSDIDNLQSLIIRDRADEALGDGMVLDVVDNLRVVSVPASRPQRLGVGLERL